MAAPRQFPGTGPYRPPAIVGSMETNPPGYGGGSGGSIATNVLENPKLAGYWDWINTLGKLYPGPVVNRGNLGGPGPIRNSRPVADRQTLTMAASRHPLPSTGQYIPPRIVGAPGVPGDHPVHDLDAEHAYVTPTQAAVLADILRRLYPKYGAAEVVGRFGTSGPVGGVIRNSRPVAGGQTTTMAARASGDPRHPLPGTGDWVPPRSIAEPLSETPVTQAHLDAYSNTRGPGDIGRLPRGVSDDDYWNLATALMRLYPGTPIPGSKNQYGLANSQAIGDRPVTTMTNPLPNYNPLTMVKGQAAAQLRAMINHALAQRGLQPLVNLPLAGAATQMGRM